MEYKINKGVGKPVEFQGLQSQYLFIFAGGLLGVFILFVIMFMAGIAQAICIIFCLTVALVLVKVTFTLSKKYGTHGLMKLQAHKSYPRFIINRRSIRKLLKQRKS